MTLGTRRGLSIGLLAFGLLSARAARAQDAASDAVADSADATDAADATTDVLDALGDAAVDVSGDAVLGDATPADGAPADAPPGDAVAADGPPKDGSATDGPPKDGGATDGAATDASAERFPYRNFENETGCCSIGGDGRSGYASLAGAGTLLALAFLRRRRR